MSTNGVKSVVFQPGFSLSIEDKDGLMSSEIETGVHSADLLLIISSLAAHRLLKILDYSVSPATPIGALTREQMLRFLDG